MANTSVNTNRPTLPRTTLSRSSVVAMMRGVSWTPATWIATSSDPNVNTTNESVSVIVVWYSACAPETDSPDKRHFSHASTTRSTGAKTSTARIESRGIVQSAERR